jgi:uncharacterized protein
MEDVQVSGHGLDHFIAVTNHAVNALKYENLSDEQKLQVELAALLHDVDDHKLFPDNKNHENARKILTNAMPDDEHLIQGIIQMIDLVSCSKNGDREPSEPWMAIPRDADRLEAIGQIGIDRCLQFNKHKGVPLHTDTTPRVSNLEELSQVVTPERFEGYGRGVPSASMIDHYYDKLLHIGSSNRLRSQNPYILEEATRRNQVMIDFVLEYWRYN